MEFVTVTFDDDRQVFIDGTPSGNTNETLQVDRGTHTFDLGAPHNYAPTFRRRQVANTTPIRPLEVTFAKS